MRKQPSPRQRQLNEEGLRTSYHESRTDSPVQVSCLNVTKCKHKKNAFKKCKVSSFQTTVFKPQCDTDWPRGRKVSGNSSKRKHYQSFIKKKNKTSSWIIRDRSNCPHPEIDGLTSSQRNSGRPNRRHINSNCSTRKYKPVGVSTSRDMPNRNMTVGQFARLQERAKILLTDANIQDSSMKIARKIASLSPLGFQVAMNKEQGTSHKVIWDSGASVCVTPDREDFIEYTKDSDIPHVKGIGGRESQVLGKGTVSWSVHDNKGSIRTLKLPAYHRTKEDGRYYG